MVAQSRYRLTVRESLRSQRDRTRGRLCVSGDSTIKTREVSFFDPLPIRVKDSHEFPYCGFLSCVLEGLCALGRAPRHPGILPVMECCPGRPLVERHVNLTQNEKKREEKSKAKKNVQRKTLPVLHIVGRTRVNKTPFYDLILHECGRLDS